MHTGEIIKLVWAISTGETIKSVWELNIELIIVYLNEAINQSGN